MRWDRVLVTPDQEHRQIEVSAAFSDLPILVGASMVGANGNETGKDERTGLVVRIRERCSVSGCLAPREILPLHRALHEGGHVELPLALRETPPLLKLSARHLLAGREEGVHGHDTGEPLRYVCHHPESEQAAPVLTDQRD